MLHGVIIYFVKKSLFIATGVLMIYGAREAVKEPPTQPTPTVQTEEPKTVDKPAE